jgi:hypothetical protein
MTNISSVTDACVNPQSMQEQTIENSGQTEAIAVENTVQNEAEAANIARDKAGMEPEGRFANNISLGIGSAISNNTCARVRLEGINVTRYRRVAQSKQCSRAVACRNA